MKSPNSLCGVLLCIPLASCASQPTAPAAPVTHRLIGQDRGLVSILAPDGTVLFRHGLGHDVDSTCAIMSDGTLLVGADDGALYALGGGQ
jgi:hypothetical protein